MKGKQKRSKRKQRAVPYLSKKTEKTKRARNKYKRTVRRVLQIGKKRSPLKKRQTPKLPKPPKPTKRKRKQKPRRVHMTKHMTKHKKGSIKKIYKHRGESWENSDAECPKIPFHQPSLDKDGKDWITVDLKKDILRMGSKYIIDDERVGTGIYIMVVMKEDPRTLHLLKEYNDLSMLQYQEYVLPKDAEWPTYGHSSIYTKQEYDMEWLKEMEARKLEKETETEQDKDSKEKLYKKAHRIRKQCLLMFAGTLYYDRGIVLWTNHSGHFQSKGENSPKVGLPNELFVPMGSREIEDRLREHVIKSPPVSPVSETKTSKMMKSFTSMMSKK
jgi:hypothetical protein